MSATKTISEREAVLRERKAFCAGASHFLPFSNPPAALRAAELYPLPKVERPRVVRETSVYGRVVEWKYEDGALWWRNPNFSTWNNLATADNHQMYVTPERVLLLADLLANPTELVEAES